jgi:hypothetical protein
MKLEGKNIIGNMTSAGGQIFFNAINPVTTQKIEPSFYEATP